MRFRIIAFLFLALASPCSGQNDEFNVVEGDDAVGSSSTVMSSTGVSDVSSTPGSPMTTISSASESTVSGTMGSTVSATVNTGSTPTPEVVTGTSPSAGTGTITTATQPPTTTTDPVAYQSVTMINALQPNSGKAVLQEALILTNEVNSLTVELNQLINEMNATTLVSELDQMVANVTQMNSTLIGLQAQLQDQITATNSLMSNYTSLASYYQCFASSNCVTGPPTTPGPTTTMGPTTTQPLNPCPTVSSYSTNDNTTYQTDCTVSNAQNSNCSGTISAGSQHLALIVSVTITGTARLDVTDAFTTASIASFTTSNSSVPVPTNSSTILFSYSALGDANSISFEIQYKAANPCDGVDCGHGKCGIDSTGKIFCTCDTCYSASKPGEKCTNEIDLCKSRPPLINCKYTGPNGPNQCGTYADNNTGKCSYYCKCDGVDDHDARSCPDTPPLFAQLDQKKEGFFSRWFN